MNSQEIATKNRENYEEVAETHNYYCIRVGELTRWAYAAIMATLYFSFDSKVPQYQGDCYQLPAVISFLAAVSGAGIDFLQFYVMAIFTKGDVKRFLRRIKARKDEIHPPRYRARTDLSWFLFNAKSIATLISAVCLIIHLILLSLHPDRIIGTKANALPGTSSKAAHPASIP
jgi:hypothetical protein